MAEDLSCSICMFRFNESSYLPLWLRCGHTFCKSCLEDIARRGKLKCPNCNAEEDSTAIDSLPKNYFILEMIVRGVFSRTSAAEEPWTCKRHPTEQLTYFAPESKTFLCAECVRFTAERKVVNVDKTRLRQLMKPYAGFYEAAGEEDMESRVTLLEQLASMLQGEAARTLLYEQQLHDGAVLALDAAAASCRRNIETYYSAETDRLESCTGVLKALRELKELGQGFDILNHISVAKQMEIIPALSGTTTARAAPAVTQPDGKYQYRMPTTTLQSAGLIVLAGARLFQESSSGEDASEYKVQRFGNLGNRWGIYEDKNQVEAITFTASKPVFLTGVGIGTCYSVGKTVAVQEIAIIQGSSTGGQKVAVETGLVLSNVDNSVKIGKLAFARPVEIQPLQEYTIRLAAKGEAGVYRGQSAQSTVTGPKQVEFSFKSSSYAPSDIKNGDNTADGPILELFYQMSKAELVSICRFQEHVGEWVCRSGCKDCISFKTTKNAKLNGVSVCAPTQPGPAMVTLEILEGGKCPGKLLFAMPTAFLLPYSAASTVKVLFPAPASIKAETVYTVQAVITGVVHKGESALGTTVTQGLLTVTFLETLYEGSEQPNGANLTSGPIAELLFGDVIESENLYGEI